MIIVTKTFLTCTNCGQKSPDTRRCKHCGRAFGRAPQQGDDSSSKRSWLPIAAVIGVAAIVAVGLEQWWRRPPVAPSATGPETPAIAAPAETAAVPTPAPPPSVQKQTPPATPVDTPRAVVPARVEPRTESIPQVADTTKLAPPPPSAEPVTIDPQRQRYVTVWANVRGERNGTAPILQVLHPGEIVAIDSLEGGWYRVTTDQPTVGYVDQQYLDTLPPGKP